MFLEVKELEHFFIFYNPSDKMFVNKIAFNLDNNYEKIINQFHLAKLDEKIKIHLFPTKQSFVKFCDYEKYEPWMVGNTRKNSINALSLESGLLDYDYNQLEKTLIHELSHYLVKKVNDKVPIWIREGLACYHANQFDKERQHHLFRVIKRGQIPTFHDLHNASMEDFKKFEGFALSYIFIKYLNEEYGIDFIVNIMINLENIELVKMENLFKESIINFQKRYL